MAERRVRAGSTYRYDPVGWDLIDPPHGMLSGILKTGDRVKVVNLPGCPKAGTMGHCHIQIAETGKFAGLVHVNSLKTEN